MMIYRGEACEGSELLRRIACAALIVATIVPIEQPAAQAENWHAVQNTSLCVDWDSEQFDDSGVTWTYKQCNSPAPPWRATVDCVHPPIVMYSVYDSSRGWIAQNVQPNTPELEMLGNECDGWAQMKG